MNKETRLIFLLCMLVTIGQLATVIYLPAFPAIARSLHTNASATEMTITVFLLSFGLSQLIYGPLSDHFGRKRIILIGLLAYAIFSLVSALAPNIEVLLVARCLEGFGAGGITAVARAAVNDSFTGKKLTTILSYTTIAASLGSMLSPSIGGYLVTYFSWRVNFYFLTLYALVFLVLTYLWLQETAKSNVTQHQVSAMRLALQRYKILLSNREYLAFMLAGSVGYGGMMFYYTASPFIFQHDLGLQPKTYGALFLLTSGAFIVGGVLNGWFHHREVLRLKLSALGLVLGAIFMVLPGLFGRMSPSLIIVPMMIYMVSCGVFYPSCMNCAVRLLHSIAGTAAAVMGCMQILAAALAAAITAHLSQSSQLPMAIALLLTAILAGSVLWFALRYSLRNPIKSEK